MQTKPDNRLREYLLDTITLKAATLSSDTIYLEWDADGHQLKNAYTFPFVFADNPAFAQEGTRNSFAAIFGAINSLRFAAMLPKKVDLTLIQNNIPKALIDFLAYCTRIEGSEFSWQLGFKEWSPELIVDPKGGNLPIFTIPEENRKVLVSMSGGKDGLLCLKLLENSGINFHMWQYLDHLYQTVETKDDRIASTLFKTLPVDDKHLVYFNEDSYLFEMTRRRDSDIEAYFKKLRPEATVAFCQNAGEPTLGMMIGAGLQAAYKLPLAVWGDEKSADSPNFVDPVTGIGVIHSGTKTLDYAANIQRCWGKIFKNLQWASLLHPFYDTAIFQLLKPVVGDLVYQTHSCNRGNPWCLECPKCLYVFSGLTANLDRHDVISQFGGVDLFQKKNKTAMWKELLAIVRDGEIPRRALECVGEQKEVQLYFWEIKQRYPEIINAPPFRLFQSEILDPLGSESQQKEYFKDLKGKYGKIYRNDHVIPTWLADPVFSYITDLNILADD